MRFGLDEKYHVELMNFEDLFSSLREDLNICLKGVREMLAKLHVISDRLKLHFKV